MSEAFQGDEIAERDNVILVHQAFHEYREKSEHRHAELKQQLKDIENRQSASESMVADIRNDISDLLVAWKGIEGASLFFGLLGKVVKWMTAVVMFVVTVYYLMHGIHPPKGG